MELIRSPPAARCKRSSRFDSLRPYISIGLKVAITLAVIGAVIGEFVWSEDGLGYLILVSTARSRTPLTFAGLVLLTVISIVLYYGIVFIEWLAVPWALKN